LVCESCFSRKGEVLMPREYAYLWILVGTIVTSCNVTLGGNLSSYNIVWNSQSVNAAGSMPVGGGDVGLNVWVENNDLLFYIGRSGTFDENNHMLKLGRVRVRLDPNPFGDKSKFRQELKLQDGYVEITGKAAGKVSAMIRIWVEIYRPVIHVDISSDVETVVNAQYEGWRNADRDLPQDCRKTRYPCMSLVGYPGKVTMYADTVGHKNDTVVWYHRNRNDDLLFEKEVKQQELEEVASEMWNPLKNLTFGGLMKGEAMVADGTVSGRYGDTDYTGWKLKSEQPRKRHKLKVYLHTDQMDNIEQWKSDLGRLVETSDLSDGSARQGHRRWWRQFWGRGHLFINSEKVDPDDKGWQVGRNYQLFRYMQGCNAYGQYPTKFNGSFFTFDPNFVKNRRGVKTETPDFRTWGGGSFTAQNQRLVYWNMLKNGDFDIMPSQFDFYRRALKNAELRTKVYWGHDGCSFTEQLENFGLPCGSIYGWLGATCSWGRREATTEKGTQSLGCVYQFGHQLDFSFMMLEYYRYSGRDISGYLPFIESSVTFFDEHYQYLEKKRSGNVVDANGHLVIYPSRAAESYVDARNPADVIAGLKAVLGCLIDLPEKYVCAEKKAKFREMLKRVPPLPTRMKNSKPYLAGAQAWRKFSVGEIPELYSVFPYGLYSFGRDGFDIARYTWTDCLMDRQKKMKEPWYQGGIFSARLGFTDYSKEVAVYKLGDSGERFPAFKHSDDWAPDHNWMGAGSIGLQEMLMQCVGDKIYLLPAWPRDWSVDFKLHAAKQTIVEGMFQGGKFVKLEVTPESRRKDVEIRK
jgi:hypothetical protein